jgi:hypothetical protein
MAVGFVRCAGRDRELRSADATLHRTPAGTRFFSASCLEDELAAEDEEEKGGETNDAADSRSG